MCIASFVLDQEKFILTFNRDEDPGRITLPPEFRTRNGRTILCPLDQVGGGTWIGYNKRIVACLQNGAFEKHIRQPSYAKSRGLILMDILSHPQTNLVLKAVDLINVEPFTLSIFELQQKLLTIFIYDGTTVHKEQKNLSKPEIIASSTLYDSTARKTITDDFNHLEKTPENLFGFHDAHRIGHHKNKFTDKVSTVSITQIVVEQSKVFCRYFESSSGEMMSISG